MVSNISVLLFSLCTFQVVFGAYRALQTNSFETGVVGIVTTCVIWALGAVCGRSWPGTNLLALRWIALSLMLASTIAWPWVGPGMFGWILLALAALVSGLVLPRHVMHSDSDPELMRDAYAKMLLGGGIGGLSGALIAVLFGTGGIFVFAAAALVLAPFLDPKSFFPLSAGSLPRARYAALPISAVLLLLVGFAPSNWSVVQEIDPQESLLAEKSFGSELVLAPAGDVEPSRKFDIFISGVNVSDHLNSISQDVLTTRIRSITAVEESPKHFAAMAEFSAPDGVEFQSFTGDGRRRLLAENRRYDVIQILTLPSLGSPAFEQSAFASPQGSLTIEAIRLYVDRLKEDGVIHVPRAIHGAWAQSALSTFAEAWKKMARPNVNLHVLAIGKTPSGKTGEPLVVKTMILRLKPFMREERDLAGANFKVSDEPNGNAWILATDGSGTILTDDRPVIAGGWTRTTYSDFLILVALLSFAGIVFWIVSQERRKEVTSRWQTFSVATYFGGLGISFAFFQVFFVLRATRMWGVPEIAMALAMSVIFISLAAGATVFAGHLRRRFGVRIQPLANFVFAALFTYLASALFEPLVASSPVVIATFIGMSVLMPFGILGGAFFPNALEEASEKLPPRAITLLWAMYALGTGIGVYAGTYVSIVYGLDVAFLAGLFCFAWVAIASGLIRPWTVRQTGKAGV